MQSGDEISDNTFNCFHISPLPHMDIYSMDNKTEL